LCITAVSLQTGKASVFSNRDLQPPADNAYNVRKFRDRDEMIKALLASGSQAGFTPPVRIGDEQFVDGGHRDVIPTRVVVDQKIDTVFVLSNNPEIQAEANKIYTSILPVVLRLIAIFVQDVRENDMNLLKDFLATLGKEPVLIAPEQDLDEENPTGLRFNPGAMMGWMVEGARRANEELERHGFIEPDDPPV
jgi:predicted acylesterase/phospholipase RssA